MHRRGDGEQRVDERRRGVHGRERVHQLRVRTQPQPLRVAAPAKGGDDRWDEAPRERANGAFAAARVGARDRDVRPLAAVRLDQQSS